MYRNNQRADAGFVALFAVIIVSSALMAALASQETASFLARFGAFDAQNKRVSAVLAESCVSVAMLRVAQDATYAPPASGACVPVRGACGDSRDTCVICSVQYDCGDATAIVRAAFGGAHTVLRVRFAGSGVLAIRSWEELNDAPVSCIRP